MIRLKTLDYLANTKDNFETICRENVVLEKGVIITENFLEKNIELFEQYGEFFSAYPDLFLDLIKPSDSEFSLFFYQRIVLRAMMRYPEVYIVAARAFSKSFLTIVAMYLQCIFMPGTKRFIVAPHKNQGAQIARQKILEIYTLFPLLKHEIQGDRLNENPGNFSKDYVLLKFKNGSEFEVVGGDGIRGLRKHGGLLDEVRDADQVKIQEEVIPLMNVSRRLPDNTVNPAEPNQQQILCTSAGVKSSYAYERLIDMLANTIITPEKSFVLGCDYRVPALHKLISEDFVRKLKMSPAFNPESFAREYLSIWSGGSEESWFNFDKLTRHRKLKNPEKHAIFREGFNQFYLLSVDVGRLSDQTVCTVFRVNVTENKFYSSMVNIFVLGLSAESKTFTKQAIDLKKIIDDFQPREVVIDTNGLKYQAHQSAMAS